MSLLGVGWLELGCCGAVGFLQLFYRDLHYFQRMFLLLNQFRMRIMSALEGVDNRFSVRAL